MMLTALQYLCVEGQALLCSGLEVPGVQRQLHLSQEGVVSEAVLVPHRQLQGPHDQLGLSDTVLQQKHRQHYCGVGKLLIQTLLTPGLRLERKEY